LHLFSSNAGPIVEALDENKCNGVCCAGCFHVLRYRGSNVLSRAWSSAFFHAEYQGQRATFTFDGKLFAGSMASRAALRLIKEWSLANRHALDANWERARAGKPLERIAPLE
jgi:hypothetical protein